MDIGSPVSKIISNNIRCDGLNWIVANCSYNVWKRVHRMQQSLSHIDMMRHRLLFI